MESLNREEYRTKFASEIHNYLETPSAEHYISDGLKDYFHKLYPPEDRYTVLKGIEKQVVEEPKNLDHPSPDLTKSERKEYIEKEADRICEQYPEETFLHLHEHGRQMVADKAFDHALAEFDRRNAEQDPYEHMKQHDNSTEYPDKQVFKDGMTNEEKLAELNGSMRNIIRSEFGLPDDTIGRDPYFSPRTDLSQFTEVKGYFHARMVHQYDDYGHDSSETINDIYINPRTENMAIVRSDFNSDGRVDVSTIEERNLTDLKNGYDLKETFAPMYGEFKQFEKIGDGNYIGITQETPSYMLGENDNPGINLLKINKTSEGIELKTKMCNSLDEAEDLFYKIAFPKKEQEINPKIDNPEPTVSRGMER